MDSRMSAVAFAALLLLLCAQAASAITASPVSPATSYASAAGNEVFTCNATDETALSSLSLLLWYSAGGAYYSDSKAVTGLSNQTNWSLTGIPPGDYVWNCIAYDNEANGAWGVNRTLHANLFYLLESGAENDETWAVAAADLDSDGDVDYIAGNYGQPNRIYKNNGTGNFTLFESSAESDNTRSVSIADLDGDGDADYIAGNYQQPVRIYKNNGTGHFTLFESNGGTEETYSIAIADFDGDGDADYAAARASTDALEIYKNNGTGHFESFQNISAQNYHVVIAADFDGDGDTDLAAGGYPFQQATLYLNNGTGYFTAAQTLSSNGVYISDMSAADIDTDGDMDIVLVPDRNFQAIDVLKNNGTGGFSSYTTFGITNETYTFAPGDFDNDGDVDGIAGNYEQNDYVFMNSGTGDFSAYEPTTGAERTVSIALADLDSDGDLDYIAGNANAVNRVYLNRQNGGNYIDVLLRCASNTTTSDCLGLKVSAYQSGTLSGHAEVCAPGVTREGTLSLHFGLQSGLSYIINATLPGNKTLSCLVQPPLSFTAYDDGSSTNGAACSVTGSSPAVTLAGPPDGITKRISAVNYSCAASVDTSLKNMTLYVWGSGGLYNMSTAGASGAAALRYWSVSMGSEGAYSWNCKACDASSRCAFAPENYTLSVLSTSRLNLRLFLNGTDSSVYMPGSGEYDSSLASVADYTPAHFYVASFGDGSFSSLVFSGYAPRSIAAGNGTQGHYIELDQDLSGSRAFLAFSSGGWEAVDARIGAIESGSFMQVTQPSFSYGLGGMSELGLALSYTAIDLQGSLKLGRGTHRITVENNGTAGGRPSVLLEIG